MMHFYEPHLGHGLKHDPFNSIVGPRPIGWVSSRSASGVSSRSSSYVRVLPSWPSCWPCGGAPKSLQNHPAPSPSPSTLSCLVLTRRQACRCPHLLPFGPACELNDQLGIVSFYRVGDPESMCGETYMISPEVQQDLYG